MLPRHITKLGRSETFTFSCHKNVKCFTECCRMLELALTPYDVLRLRLATGLTSGQLLDEYIIIEQDQGEPFPRLYLTMVDDGRASCVFVSAQGCTVYPHRPSACRAYPLGRLSYAAKTVLWRSISSSCKKHTVKALPNQHHKMRCNTVRTRNLWCITGSTMP